MSDILRKQPNHQIATSIYPLGEHKEKYWRSEFALFYKWLLP
jgi:hypothetical protein